MPALTPIPFQTRKILVAILAAGVLLRVLYVALFVDLSRDFYWEYGEIAKNLHAGFGYSLFHSSGGMKFEDMAFNPAEKPLPSAYMPAGYVFFLLPFFSIGSIELRNVLILGAQIVLSCFIVLLVFRFCARYIQPTSALIAAAIVAVLPEFVYASCSFSPTVFYHAGVLVTFLLLYDKERLRSSSASVLVGFVCAALIYFRSEFAAFVLIAVLHISRKSGLRSASLTFGTILILFLPWQIRNHSVFGEWIPLTTSGGLNFFRGHNEVGIGAWGDEQTNAWLNAAAREDKFELEQSKMFFRRGVEFAREHPAEELQNSVLKVLHLWFLNPNDERTKHPLYLIPWGFMLALAGFGIARGGLWRRHFVVMMFLAYSTGVAILFFALPRYQTMMKIALVPFAAVGIEALWKHIRVKTKTEGRG